MKTMSKSDTDKLVAVIETKLEMYTKIVEELKQIIEKGHESHAKIYEVIKTVDEKHSRTKDFVNMAIGALAVLQFGIGILIAIWK
jgi:ERCC4-type nuclease